MARRLTLLALIACIAARRPLPPFPDDSDSESIDPFALWEDYDTYETPDSSTPTTIKPSVKVLLKSKLPELNVSMKNKSEVKSKGENKSKIFKTTINILSHTNIFVTKPPVFSNSLPSRVTKVPQQSGIKFVEPVWIDDVVKVPELITNPVTKPVTTLRPNTTRKRSTTTTRRPPKTTRRRPTTTTPRQFTTRKQQKQKSTKVPVKRKSTCPPKGTWWLSSFFEENNNRKSPKKQEKAGNTHVERPAIEC